MKVALIAVSALAGLLGLALVTVVLGGSSSTIGDEVELEHEGDTQPGQDNDPTRRVTTEIYDGGRWKDVDLEITLLEAREVDPPRGDTIGIEGARTVGSSPSSSSATMPATRPTIARAS